MPCRLVTETKKGRKLMDYHFINPYIYILMECHVKHPRVYTRGMKIEKLKLFMETPNEIFHKTTGGFFSSRAMLVYRQKKKTRFPCGK